jgi:iron-sulfur cluster repair protein YtfE (RIC family)
MKPTYNSFIQYLNKLETFLNCLNNLKQASLKLKQTRYKPETFLTDLKQHLNKIETELKQHLNKIETQSKQP